jgi:RNA polymerase sigma-70 factor (ECF subfamily)
MNAAGESHRPAVADFAGIYREHHRRVLNLCTYLLNSATAAEDAAHEVFLRVQRNLDAYNPAYCISNWILKIASNYCMDLLRKRAREKRLFVADPPDVPDPSSNRPGALGEILKSETGRNVRRALASLNDKFRIPLILSFYNDFSYDEIAAFLDIPRNTVATLLFRGKQQLREKLKKEKYHAMP